MKTEEIGALAAVIRGLINDVNAIHDDLTLPSAGVAPVVLVSDAQSKLNELTEKLEAVAQSLEAKLEP